MCTAIIRFQPEHQWPLLVASLRDEDRSRAWEAPAAWWPETHPGVIGGRDLTQGGTWLAVDPRRQRVAILLNRTDPVGVSNAPYQSRGILPLDVVAGRWSLTTQDMAAFRPFNLVFAERQRVIWWRYDGLRLRQSAVGPGLHMINASNLDDEQDLRQAYWAPLFADAAPPTVRLTGTARESWGEWIDLLAGSGMSEDDDRALNVKRVSGRPNVGTVSGALVALSVRGEIRFDFSPAPPDHNRWERVACG